MAAASIKDVADYFRKGNQPLKEFTEEWKLLSDKDKEELKQGIGDGTLDY
jgi:hypothetical protein